MRFKIIFGLVKPRSLNINLDIHHLKFSALVSGHFRFYSSIYGINFSCSKKVDSFSRFSYLYLNHFQNFFGFIRKSLIYQPKIVQPSIDYLLFLVKSTIFSILGITSLMLKSSWGWYLSLRTELGRTTGSRTAGTRVRIRTRCKQIKEMKMRN